MAKIIDVLPELQGEEMIYVQNMIKDMDNEKAQTFASVYRARRKEPNLILITALLGFVGFAGIHRMLINQIGMGILYLFTGGLCLVGTIVDLVNYQKLSFEYNQKVANEVIVMVKWRWFGLTSNLSLNFGQQRKLMYEIWFTHRLQILYFFAVLPA